MHPAIDPRSPLADAGIVSTPRWWRATISTFLADLDVEFQTNGRSGPVTIEIHYRSGHPMRGKIWTVQTPPLAEFNVAATTS